MATPLTRIKPVMYLLTTWLCIAACGHGATCREGLNLLPEYGHIQKCPLQLAADSAFLQRIDSNFKTRREAARYFANRGWQYFNKQLPDSAMKRFNQSWLLDTTNADVYWGFANLLAQQQHHREAMHYFGKALTMDPDNALCWYNAGLSLGQLYHHSKDGKVLDSAILYFKNSVAIKPNTGAYAQLATCYAYTQQDSAKKYSALAKQTDSTAFSPEVRQVINEK